jgi:hypothetical protein
LEDFGAPILIAHTEELGVGGVGVFGNPLPSQPVQQVFRQIYPRKSLLIVAIRVQLVKRVQGNDLNARESVKPVRRNSGLRTVQRFHIARVAITERIRKGSAFRVQAYVVHRPTVYANRRDSFGRKLRAGAQTVFYTSTDAVDVPTKIVSFKPGRIREAMNESDLRLSADPPQQGDSTTFRA